MAIVIKLMYEYGGFAWAILRLYGVAVWPSEAVLSFVVDEEDEADEPLAEPVEPDDRICCVFMPGGGVSCWYRCNMPAADAPFDMAFVFG